MTINKVQYGCVGERRIHRLNDARLLRRLPWKAEDRQPILEALGSAQVPDEIDVRALRQREGLSQRDFARIYGLPYPSVRSWECGVTPSQSTRAYLRTIEVSPHIVRRSLGLAY
jgi:DNA-binding transcriptional regulator YiaG